MYNFQQWTTSDCLYFFSVVRNREQEIVETCRPPSITNVDATLHSDAMVTVTWEYSKGRSLPYCNGSRLFSMANISYATYEEAISNDTVIFSDGDYQDAGKRSTEFNISSVDTNHFYRFLVRARKGGSSTIHTKAVATTLKYFQETGGWVAGRGGRECMCMCVSLSLTHSCIFPITPNRANSI